MTMHMKRYSASLAIREMEIKTTVRFHFTLAARATVKKAEDDKGC